MFILKSKMITIVLKAIKHIIICFLQTSEIINDSHFFPSFS